MTRRRFVCALGNAAALQIGKEPLAEARELPLNLRYAPEPKELLSTGKATASSGRRILRARELESRCDRPGPLYPQFGLQAVAFHSTPALAPFRGVDLLHLAELDTTRLRRAVAGFQRIEIHGPISMLDVCLVNPDPIIRRVSVEEIRRHLDFAAQIGATVLNVHPGSKGAPIPAKERLAFLSEALHEIEARSKSIRHVHLHDCDGKQAHLRIGQGTVLFRDILGTLHRVKCRGFFTLETATLALMGIKRKGDLVRKWIDEIWGSSGGTDPGDGTEDSQAWALGGSVLASNLRRRFGAC